MYCVYGASRSSLLLESTDSVKLIPYGPYTIYGVTVTIGIYGVTSDLYVASLTFAIHTKAIIIAEAALMPRAGSIM